MLQQEGAAVDAEPGSNTMGASHHIQEAGREENGAGGGTSASCLSGGGAGKELSCWHRREAPREGVRRLGNAHFAFARVALE